MELSPLLRLIEKGSEWVTRYKRRQSQVASLPVLIDKTAKSLDTARQQADYWAGRVGELSAQLTQQQSTLEEGLRWLAEHEKDYERFEALASEKTQRLAEELRNRLSEGSDATPDDL